MMPFLTLVFDALDLCNRVYDFMRITTYSKIKDVGSSINDSLQNISKERMKTTLENESKRRRRDREASLPRDRSISFFDEYEIINGCPVFTIDALGKHNLIGESVGRMVSTNLATWSTMVPSAELPVTSLRRPLSSSQRFMSFRLEDLKITCYVFSHDDKYLAYGLSDGSVAVWRSFNGSIYKTLVGEHAFPVAALVFMENDSNKLLSVDADGVSVQWDIETGVGQRGPHCAPIWEDASFVGEELATPALSPNGQFLGYPIYAYTQPDSPVFSPHQGRQRDGPVPLLFVMVSIFDLTRTYRNRATPVSPMLVLPVQIDEIWSGVERLVNLIKFSRSSTSVLLTVYDLRKAYLVLWPEFAEMDVSSYQLNGRQGNFSFDDRYVVTWSFFLTPGDHQRDSNAYIYDLWNLSNRRDIIDDLKSNWQHPRYKAKDPVILTDPNYGSIQMCDFVNLRQELGIVMFSLAEELSVVVWHFESRSPLHILRTGFPRVDVCPTVVFNGNQSLKPTERLVGANCIAVSENGTWFGVYGGRSRRGIVWNSAQGVEVLRIRIPEQKLSGSSCMDLFFSKTAAQFLLLGRTDLLLWSPSVLRSFNPVDRPIYEFSCADEDINVGELISKFSKDGSVVGLVRFNAEFMSFFRLAQNKSLTLRRASAQEVDRDSLDVRVPAVAQSGGMRQTAHRRGNTFYQITAARDRFCNFALSQDGGFVVTVMGDMSVLLWSERNIRAYTKLEVLGSYFCPVLDVCFSADVDGNRMVVACQDQGILVWIDVARKKIVHSEKSGGARSCKFSPDGTTALIMSTIHRAFVWDVVNREMMRTLDYSIPILNSPKSAFNPKLSPNGDYCLVGFDKNQSAVLATQETQLTDLDTTVWYPEIFEISDDGEWVIMGGIVDRERDDLRMEEKNLPHFGQASSSERFPSINFKGSLSSLPELGFPGISGSTSTESAQTFKIVNIRENVKPKQIRIPCRVRLSKFLSLSLDGSKCAVLSEDNKLVVWGTHFTYKNIIQQRSELKPDSSRKEIRKVLDHYGPALLNHPFDGDVTLLLECVKNKQIKMLEYILDWAIDTGTVLSYHGSEQAADGDGEVMFNFIDKAIDFRSPEAIKILLDAMVDGATSDYTLAQVIQQSFLPLSYKYPELVLKLFRNPKLMRPRGKISISENFLRRRNDYIGVTADERFLASAEYVQNMWERTEDKKRRIEGNYSKSRIQAEAKVIPYPDVAKIGQDGILQPLLFSRRLKHFVFGTDLVKSVINFKFETYIYDILYEDFCHYLLLLFLFTAVCIWTGYNRRKGKYPDYFKTLVAIAVVVGLGNFVKLLNQIRSLCEDRQYNGIIYYMRDWMKLIELTSYIVVVISVPISLMADKKPSNVLVGFMASASVLLWMKLLYYAQAFKATGPMVVMVKEIIKDIIWFLFVLAAFLIGFGVAFFLLLAKKSTEPEDGSMAPDEDENVPVCDCDIADFPYFRNIFTSLMAVFLLMLTDISDVLTEIYDTNEVSEGTQVLAVLMAVVFLVAVAIVLLNLLIAIMGESFDRVKKHEKTQFLQRRAEVIQDMEMTLSRKRKEELNKSISKYIHILVPEFKGGIEELEWEGRPAEVRRTRGEVNEGREMSLTERQEIMASMDQIRHELMELRSSMARAGALQAAADDD